MIVGYKIYKAISHQRPLWALVFGFWLIVNQAVAQNPYTAGNTFVFGYGDVLKTIDFKYPPPIADTIMQVSVLLVGANPACGTVTVKGLGFKQPFTINQDSTVQINLPDLATYPFEQALDYGIVVESNAPVNAYMLVNPSGGHSPHQLGDYAGFTEVSAQVPYKNLDSVMVAYSSQSPAAGTGVWGDAVIMTLCSVEPNHVIRFKLSNSAALSYTDLQNGQLTRFTDSTYEVVLNRGQVFSLYVKTARNYDPGTRRNFIGSTFWSPNGKPFNLQVFSGTSGCLSEPGLQGIGTNIYEQQHPVRFWDTAFYAPGFESYVDNQYTIVASAGNTELYFNGQYARTIDSLHQLDTAVVGPLVIQTSKPCGIFTSGCPTSYYNDNSASHPAITLFGAKNTQTRSVFRTIDEPDTGFHYVLALITPTAGVSSITLNDTALNPNLFTPFTADSSWSWASFEIPLGIHEVESPFGFNGYHYTWSHDGIPANYKMAPAYAYNLAESVPWPQDSFVFKAGLNPNQLEPYTDFNQELCPGQPLYLQASHLRHTTWYWDFGTGSSIKQRVTHKRAQPIQTSWQQPGQYWVTATDSSGCAAGDSLLITVSNAVNANFTATTNTGCSGTIVQLHNQSTGATDYLWQWPGGSSTAFEPAFHYTGQDSTIEITLIAKNELCADTLTQTVQIQDSEFKPEEIPNVFTPNNDGVNDAFCIPNTFGFTDCFNLQIFNRWGRLVFESNEPQNCWQGESAADGVYFYVLKFGEQQYQGEVTVMR